MSELQVMLAGTKQPPPGVMADGGGQTSGPTHPPEIATGGQFQPWSLQVHCSVIADGAPPHCEKETVPVQTRPAFGQYSPGVTPLAAGQSRFWFGDPPSPVPTLTTLPPHAAIDTKTPNESARATVRMAQMPFPP